MSDSMIIHADALVRHFGSGSGAVEAVRGIDLAVEPGEVFGLLGPNGAGKTTTIRMLTGQLRPTRGTAAVAGCDVVRERRELHRRIGVVFDVPNLYDQLSARENLKLFAEFYGADPKRIPELLELTDMTDAADRRFKTFSKGMKQRILLARALLPQPQVLFLDEPTAGLDPASARRVRDLVFEQRDQGVTVFLTTHSMELADQVCGRLAIVHAGRIAALDTPARLKHAHAEPVLVVRRRSGDPVTLSLTDGDTPDRVAELLRAGDVEEVATQEPSLEDVFLGLTGSELQ